jgi:hypothetical protein
MTVEFPFAKSSAHRYEQAMSIPAPRVAPLGDRGVFQLTARR